MNKRFGVSMAAAVLGLSAGVALAQEEGAPPMTEEQQAMMAAWAKAATPGEAHAHLAKSAGKWKVKSSVWMEPGGEPMVTEGTAVREAILGGRVIRETYASSFMGQPFTGVAHTGYDNVQGKFWSSWVDNMSTDIYIGEGECSEDYSSCSYTMSGSDPTTGADSVMRIEMQQDGDSETHVFYENRGGEEVKTMELVYTRAGP